MLDGQLQWPGYQVLHGWLVIRKFTFFRSLLVTHDMPLFLTWSFILVDVLKLNLAFSFHLTMSVF